MVLQYVLSIHTNPHHPILDGIDIEQLGHVKVPHIQGLRFNLRHCLPIGFHVHIDYEGYSDIGGSNNMYLRYSFRTSCNFLLISSL